jgi:hypothetical protein
MRVRSLLMPWLASATIALAALVNGRARADDWLAVLPACDARLGRDAGPIFEIAYPRPGLPALVEAGQVLIARVRLPSPLTPPPGVQQERALRGFGAELIGHARAIGAGGRAPLKQRYPIEVVNVRPDASASLVYRVSLPIPAWAAPGTYDLELSAPGGKGRARALVRVLAQGEAARLAWTLGGDPPASAAVAALPIDVWVRAAGEGAPGEVAPLTDTSAAVDAAPVLDTRELSAALRVGDELWVLGGCDTPQLRFSDVVGSVLASERRARRDVPQPTRAAGDARGYRPWHANAGFVAWPPDDALQIEEDAGGALRIAARPPLSHAELGVLFASGGDGLSASAGTLRFYPARELTATVPLPLVARVQLAGAGEVRIQRVHHDDSVYPALSAYPREVPSGEPLRVRPRCPGPSWRIAYRVDAQRTAFTGCPNEAPALEYSFQALGPHRIDALAIAADGASRRIHADVRVVTAQRVGCRCQLGAPIGVSPAGAALAAAAALACARQVRSRRNRARKARSIATPE